jgi:hypothetical protein
MDRQGRTGNSAPALTSSKKKKRSEERFEGTGPWGQKKAGYVATTAEPGAGSNRIQTFFEKIAGSRFARRQTVFAPFTGSITA